MPLKILIEKIPSNHLKIIPFVCVLLYLGVVEMLKVFDASAKLTILIAFNLIALCCAAYRKSSLRRKMMLTTAIGMLLALSFYLYYLYQ